MSRLLVIMLLLLATAFSGPADAALRAVAAGSHVVICAEGAAVTVAQGADGLPSDPRDDRRHCPDCLPIALTATGGAEHSGVAPPAARHAAAALPAAFPPRVRGHAALPAPRGPPSGET